jgi:farnesyl diphosphate synthase
MPININTLVNQEKRDFNVYYRKLLKSHLLNDELSKAIIYGSMNGGKRIRPCIISVFAKNAKIKKNNYLRLSASVESIHSYSLIHDDLPSMDDDDYRRGKLSVHKKFNEAKAILAGDALHDLAFEILSDKKTHKKSDVRINLVEKLSKKLGSKGLAGGQSLDLLFENNSVTVNQILKMYLMKTSSLFSYCCTAPFILAEKNKKDLKFAEEFGNLYGLVFQIIDDISDETENFLSLGKTPGKDKRQGKSTLVSNVNKEKAIVFCNKKINKFIRINKKFFSRWQILEEVLRMFCSKFIF